METTAGGQGSHSLLLDYKGVRAVFFIQCDSRAKQLVVLVINRVSILADFGHFGYGVCTLALIWVCFLRRSHFFIIIEKKINKSPLQIIVMVI